MRRYLGYIVCLSLFPFAVAVAEVRGKSDDGGEKVVSGMSIIGSDETPKSLVIIPWKSSEIGQETSLKSNLLDDGLKPVDKVVFMRELDFYKLGNSN